MSVDLWTAYLDTALDIYQTSEDFEWTIKSIYERSIEAAGLEFRSDKLWEHYISWTSNNGRLSDATKIYDQLLRTATQMYYQNWENFKKHVEDNETQSIIPPEEMEMWKRQVMAGKKGSSKDASRPSTVKEEVSSKENDSGESMNSEKVAENMEIKPGIDTKSGSAKETTKETDEKMNSDYEKTEVKPEEESLKDKEHSKVEKSKPVSGKTDRFPDDKGKTVSDKTDGSPDGKRKADPVEIDGSKIQTSLKETPSETGDQKMEKMETNDTENGDIPVLEEKEKVARDSVAAKDLSSEDWSTIKMKFIEDREQVYQKTYEQITKRWYFEEKIRRPYFHVKPLEKSQLTNWREYLDMEIAEGDFQRVCSLFERCLIACALYDEFWVRYATYLESEGRIEDARHVWENACTVHLPHRPHLHWRWALFEERQKNNKAAVDVITRGHRECIGDVKLAIRRLSLLRRSGTISIETLCAEYESTIEQFASENIACASVLSLKYSRFLDRERGDREQAERVLREAIARDETNERLYMQLVDLNYRQPSFDWRACDRVLAWIVGLTSLPRRLRLRFCQRRYEMLEEASDDVIGISSALRDYEELLQDSEFFNEKDGQSDANNAAVDPASTGVVHSGSVNEDEPPTKRARSSTSGAAGTMSSDAMSYAGSSYDPVSYHHYGSTSGGVAAAADGSGMGISADASHLDNSMYSSVSSQSHSGAASNPQAYAAAAAAAAASAAYPGYSGSGSASWDSYYNSYYGYYAGYYGAAGTSEHSDWQTQNTS